MTEEDSWAAQLDRRMGAMVEGRVHRIPKPFRWTLDKCDDQHLFGVLFTISLSVVIEAQVHRENGANGFDRCLLLTDRNRKPHWRPSIQVRGGGCQEH